MSKATLGVIVGNRNFFPDQLVTEARADILDLFGELDIAPVMLDDQTSKLGGVETREDALKCARLFAEHADEIDGLLVLLPNFGDERGVAETVQLSGLDVPILVQAYPDNLDQFTVERRRDAFCGKISVCNNLGQYGIPFSLTELHTVHPKSASFRQDLDQFLGVCRVVNGLRGARLGAIGARPAAFNTVRYSERILQDNGITVVTADLSEIIGRAAGLADDAPQVVDRLQALKDYIPTDGVPAKPLLQMARLAAVIEEWMDANAIDATALQCWDSIQINYGISPCSVMSFMSDRMLPSACEVDVTGAVSMYALQLAAGRPSALVDWNNNYADDPDKCVLFHCSNWPKSMLTGAHMHYGEILGTSLGSDRTYGAIAGRVPAGPMGYARVSTLDTEGTVHCYVGDGAFTDDPLTTFGSTAVVEVPDLQFLLKYICRNQFEHHVAMAPGHTSDILAEAFETYFGWDVYQHMGY
ncbi:MAG: L-fucose/L-arabinose isomerase family protein [Anaerolineae bacterium]